MPKNKTKINVILILVLAFLSLNFCYPKYFNDGVDFINSSVHLGLPHFLNKPFLLGLDLQGGANLVYQADLSNVPEASRSNVMSGLRDIMERRINAFGVSEPVVQVEGQQLVVQLAGVFNVSKAINLIGQTPFLEFMEQLPASDSAAIIESSMGTTTAASVTPSTACQDVTFVNQFIQTYKTNPCFQPTQLTGKYLSSATVQFNQTSYAPEVSLQFNSDGAKIFQQLTSQNVGKILGIFIDGQAISLPTVQEAISGGQAQITGNFTVKEVQDLVKNLNAGALPVPITLISQQSVGPTLGKISLQQSLEAGLLGFLAVILFMIIFYRFSGFLASLALIVYVSLVLSIFKLIPVTLTLAGIGGFILSIGMAVDANVLIFSRFREELREGKEFKIALDEGFRRAWPAIRDGNVTTLIVAVILFAMGSSFVKGFAFSLSIGVLVSMFSAIVITKNFMKIFESTKLAKIRRLWS